MNSIRTLIVYDTSGAIIRSCDANSQEPPQGVPYMVIDLPIGVTVTSIDMKTGLPNYSSSSAILSEIDKMNAKMDYIAMVSDISLDYIDDVYGSMPQTIIDDNAESHSENYIKVYNYYMANLWSIMAIRLAIGKWITQQEYNNLVKMKTSQDTAVDTENKIPVVNV